MDKHEDTMSKMGAILASGILDAGGRNVTIKLLSKSKHDKSLKLLVLLFLASFGIGIRSSISLACHSHPLPLLG